MLVRNQCCNVPGAFNLLLAVIATRMGRDHGLSIENAHLIRRGGHGQRPRYAGMRNRVVIEVKAHIGGLARRDGFDLIAREGIAGQFKEAGSFLSKRLTDGERFVLRATPFSGMCHHPGIRLSIEVSKISEAAAGKEGVTDIADGAFDTPLLISPGHRDWTGLETIMTGQGQEGRVETDDGALPLKYRTLEVVIKGDPRYPIPGIQGGDLAAPEILHVGAEVETQEDL